MNGSGDIGQAITEAIFIVLTWAIPLVLLAFFVYALVRYFTRPSSGRGRPAVPPDALEVLRQRYARGEIADEEYARRRKTLAGT